MTLVNRFVSIVPLFAILPYGDMIFAEACIVNGKNRRKQQGNDNASLGYNIRMLCNAITKL
jgi:hypothetical protein